MINTNEIFYLEELIKRFPKCFQILIRARLLELHDSQIEVLNTGKITLSKFLSELSYTRVKSADSDRLYTTSNSFWLVCWWKMLKSKKIIITHELYPSFIFHTNLNYWYRMDSQLIRHFEKAMQKHHNLDGVNIKDFTIEMK